MPTDPDQVRVDLLRVKRKLYISYPEGSKERTDFMLAAKMSELSYLQHLVTPDMVDIVFEEYLKVLKGELLSIFISLCVGGSFSVMCLGFHQLHQDSFLLSLWPIPLVVGLTNAGRHVSHMVTNWRKLQPFKKDYAMLQGRISNVLSEIRKLTGRE